MEAGERRGGDLSEGLQGGCGREWSRRSSWSSATGETITSTAAFADAAWSRSRSASTCATIPPPDSRVLSKPRSIKVPSGPNAIGVATSVHQENQTGFSGGWKMWIAAVVIEAVSSSPLRSSIWSG